MPGSTKIIIQGSGTTFSMMEGGTGTAVAFVPKTIGIPGWEKSTGDDSDLSNAEFATEFVGKLKKFGKLSLKGCNFAAASVNAIPEDNSLCTATFPNAAGTCAVWAQVSKTSFSELSNEAKDFTFDVELTLTNRNATGVETGPVFTAGTGA